MPGVFVPRLNDNGITSSPYYYSNSNPFYAGGVGMPNCTAYAYGRYYEARGGFDLPDLPHWNANQWWADATAFQRGSTPALGSVICWDQTGAGATGHVAIVEVVYANGDIVISESHSTSGLPFFDTQTLHASAGYMDSMYLGSSFSLQGFIYSAWGTGGGTPLPSASWHAKNTGGYSRTSQEAFDNAICTYAELSRRGWTLNAICAVYGNMEAESGYNPWRWESDNVPSYPSMPSYGYGLPQFTPSSKYIDSAYAQAYTNYNPHWSDHTGSPDDGEAQIQFIDEHADYYSTTAYPLSYAEFKVSTMSAGDLAKAWLYNYERPADPTSTENDRADCAEYWYGVLAIYDPNARRVKPWMVTRKAVKNGFVRPRRLSRY